MENKALHILSDMHTELDYSLKAFISSHVFCMSPTDPFQLTVLPQKAKTVGAKAKIRQSKNWLFNPKKVPHVGPRPKLTMDVEICEL